MVGLTGGMFLSGHTTPRLGIDLAGGTTITLSAVPEKGKEGAINQDNMNTAVSIIERRVNGLGVSEAEVQTQGDRNIIVNIPEGTDEQEAREQVGTTAELGFRPVLTTDVGVPADSGSSGDDQSSGDTGDEQDSGSGDQPDSSPSPDSSESPDSSGGAGDASDETDNQSMIAPGSSAGSAATASTVAYQAADSGGAGDATADPSESAEPSDGSGDTSDSGDEASDAANEEAEALQRQFDQLDCSTEEAFAQANQVAARAKDSDAVVACGNDGYKYLLGPVSVPGRDVTNAEAVFDTQTGKGWIVQMEFNDAGAGKFADVTELLASQADPMNRFAIVLDGQVVSAPSVSERLGGGRAEISGSFNQDSAEELANILKYGALPLTFEESSVSTVSPTLGGEQLRAGLIAGAIGLLLVVVYMVTYYRGLALVAITSLVVSSILTYTIMSLLGPAIGFALNLPAVCGAIAAIGITADSFIVYFERIRDEIREGRSLRPAVERAWPRARRTILVSDFVSFLAAAVLFVVTVGKVQGFAFTLGLTTALDVVVVFLFTKPLMTLLARRRFFASGHPWSGLDPRRLGVRPPLRRGARPVTVPSDPKEA